MKINLDAIDRQILAMLQEDAKINIKEIAAKLNITKTPIYERIKRLEKEGVIEKYITVLNRKKLSSSIIVFLEGSLKVEKFEQADEFFAAVAATPEIIECYLLGGENDFMLKVIAPELDKYHDFYATKIASLPRVGQIKSSFVIKEIKHSMKLPNLE
ncbi:Lrp/AsnC family transcriptional regulator [Saprospiraceae bacterium]|jgi:DNA-binding Lrp family transcriptional regulator|nr:Lrp/AsnC family transcriptional regulator [Saprospiraceae bacterium]MDC3253656.1 Lrp/AsnC family transcriptional regulator [bacterium]MDG1434600.1 Lrp/AsnC family transcriptional regulator [Saprospiraceae bacterium]